MLAHNKTQLVLTALAIAALAFGVGCKKKKNQAPPEEKGSIFKDAGRSGPSDPRYGSQGAMKVERPSKKGGDESTGGGGKVTRNYKNCTRPTPVTKADEKTAEGTLYKAFEALLMDDDEAAFAAFYAHVDPDFQQESHARRYWFKSARKDDGKAFKRLVYGDDDPSFDVCSKRKEGDGVRIFVGKSPPVGSNPPFVLHKVEDKWLIKSFTPH